MSVTALSRSAGRPRSAKVTSSGLRSAASSCSASSAEAAEALVGAKGRCPSTWSSSSSSPSASSSSGSEPSSGSFSGRFSSPAVSTSSGSSSDSTKLSSSSSGVWEEAPATSALNRSSRLRGRSPWPEEAEDAVDPVVLLIDVPVCGPSGPVAECGAGPFDQPLAAPHPPHSPRTRPWTAVTDGLDAQTHGSLPASRDGAGPERG